jgi:hypothetical protein
MLKIWSLIFYCLLFKISGDKFTMESRMYQINCNINFMKCDIHLNNISKCITHIADKIVS